MFRVIALLAAALLGVAADKAVPTATPAASLKVAKDFKAELLYSVPKDKQGSWVNLCVDPKGRLVTSDQYGPLYRITPPPIGGKPEETKVEKLPIDIGEAQGLLFAFDSLYVVVNKGKKYDTGLYRVPLQRRPTIRSARSNCCGSSTAAANTGRTRCLPIPTASRIVVVCGDGTKLTEFDTTRVPKHWGEDHSCHACRTAAASWPASSGRAARSTRVDPDGKNWELFSVGYRNEFDAAFNRHGELFTYDADMEWDINTPWYRPTRVCLVTSGSEFGWRNGAGKWPPYYPDSLPAIYDVGPGSPTGMAFGYGAKFPAKYQEAFFMCDWSYGKLYAAASDAGAEQLQGRTGRVRQRLAAAVDRRRRQPEGRGAVLHHRRPAGAVGTVSRHLHRQGIDRRRR